MRTRPQVRSSYYKSHYAHVLVTAVYGGRLVSKGKGCTDVDSTVFKKVGELYMEEVDGTDLGSDDEVVVVEACN